MGKQTSSKQWNIPMLNQGHTCRIATLGGKSPPSKNRESSYKGYTKWLYVARDETSLGYIYDTQSQGSPHKAQ